MIKFVKQKNNKGFTLIEVLVAVFVLSLAITGMMSVLSRGLTNIDNAKNKIIATYLAQEGIESILNTRDAYVIGGYSWNTFRSNLITLCGNSNGCYIDLGIMDMYKDNDPNKYKLYINNGGYSTDVSSNYSGFKRKITAQQKTLDEVSVSSTVSWNNDTQTVTFSEHLFNWIQ